MSELIFRFNTLLVLQSAILTVGLVIRLLHGKLWSRYRFFFLFLLFGLFRLLVVSLVPLSRKAYSTFYIATEGANLILYVLITLELYSLLFERYPGIQSLTRWVTFGAMGVALLLATFSLQPDVGGKNHNFALDYLLIAERGVLSGLAVLIVLMSFFLIYFPITLPRNVVTHTVLFASYFLAKASVLLVRNLNSNYDARSYSALIGAFGSLCLLAWIIRLRPSGESVLTVVGHQWNRTEESKLIRQLEQVNAALARSARE